MMLLPALPEETLYSRCLRTRDVYGMTAEQFFTVFFHKRVLTVHPYLNTSLNILSENTTESGHELWSHQTLIPLYAWALPEYRPALEDLSQSAIKLQTICKLCSFGEYHPLGLKHCPVCTCNDIKQFGVAYWHRQHQIFGVASCNHHQVRLISVTSPRLSTFMHHLSQNQEKTLSQSNKYDFKFAILCENTLEAICNGQPGFINCRRSPLIQALLQHLTTRDSASVFESLYTFSSKLSSTYTNFLPTQHNYINYWKTLLYSTSPQSPSRYLILLYCLNELNA